VTPVCCITGQSQASWQAAQDHASGLWAKTLEKVTAGTSGVKWDAHLLRCMDASFAKISWEAYQAQVQGADYQWTLVHGDFHPANILWRWPTGNASGETPAQSLGSPVLLDFEVVGLGSGPQDLAQYLISHASPEDRRGCEQELLRDYYAHLTGPASRVDPARYTLAQCEADYVAGGVGRWVWLLALLSGMCPDVMTQFFHDQVLAFMVDHGVTPESIAMPRV
jgi:thiamine kinase-like enzyme